MLGHLALADSEKLTPEGVGSDCSLGGYDGYFASAGSQCRPRRRGDYWRCDPPRALGQP